MSRCGRAFRTGTKKRLENRLRPKALARRANRRRRAMRSASGVAPVFASGAVQEKQAAVQEKHVREKQEKNACGSFV